MQRRTDFNLLTVFDEQVTSNGDGLFLHFAFVADNGELSLTTNEFHADNARVLGDLGCTLRGSSFEEFHHARQTVGDVTLGHTTRVEGTHG